MRQFRNLFHQGGLLLRRLLKLGVPTLAKFICKQVVPEKQFEGIIRSFLLPQHAVLDAGCGIRTVAAVRGCCRMVVGVDTDERSCSNPGVDMLVLADLDRLPFRENTFNVVMSHMVVEHLDNPQACFDEFGRVCKDGALVVILTPNLLHYICLITALTPYGFHKWFIRHALGVEGESHPTRYRANTPRKLVKMMESAGFTTLEVRCIDSRPAYLHWLTPLFAAGVVYHRLVTRFEKLSCFRSIMIGVFRRISR